MRPHDKSYIVIELRNIFDEVKGIPAEDHIKDIVTEF